MILELKGKDKINQFITIFTNIQKICTDTNLVIGKDGLYTQGLSLGNASIVEVNLNRDWFDNSKGNLDNKLVGIHCEILANVMKCYQEGQSIKISLYEESTEELIIYFEGKGHDKEFKIKMMDIDSAQLEIPEIETVADLTINSVEFTKIILQLKYFGEYVKISMGHDDNIYMETSGDVGNMKVRIKEEDIEEYGLEEGETYTGSFMLGCLQSFCSFLKLNEIMTLHFIKDNPMCMIFNLDDWKTDEDWEKEEEEEEKKPKNYVRFYLAPSIDD
jgi:proliferating cell nuclear antigen PCNA